MPDTLPGPDRASAETSGSASKGYGPASLTLLVVASMVGSGIFTTSGYTLGAVGSPLRVLLCWFIGGAIAVCGAIAYGNLARLMPQSGGEYLYLSRSVHPVAGFLAGWVSLTAGFSGAIAFAAVAFEKYALPENVRPGWLPADALSIVAILTCAVAHGLKAGWGKGFQNVAVVIKIGVLSGFLIYAVARIPFHTWYFEASASAPAVGMPLFSAIAASLVWISLSYAGFNAAVYVASESPEARRSVPSALLYGTLLVTLLYLILNTIFVTAVPASDLIWQEPVAAIAAFGLGGKPLEILIRIAVCLGLLTSISGMIMTGPRVYSQMADDDVFPSLFRAQSGGIPRSIALQAAISTGLIIVQRILVETGLLQSSLLGLLIYLGTTLSVSSACCVLTLFLPGVRRRLPATNLLSDFAAAIYASFTLASVLILILTHQVDGTGRVGQHVAGFLLTILSGLLAWKLLGKAGQSAGPETTE